MNNRPLLITSNGFGMGHLVRQLTLAEQFNDATVLTLSGAAPIALSTGARLEYCPSYSMPWLSKRSWHRGYLHDRIVALAQEVKADVLVFDGVVPYVGLINAIRTLGLPAVWMRRGLWRGSAMTWPLQYSSIFDLVIEPGDVGASRDCGPTKNRRDAQKVGVITAAGQMRGRDEAAAALGIDLSKPTLLFNVGSNRGIDFFLLDEVLASHSEWNIISTSDALGRQRSAHSITQIAGLFPLHPYLSAVDLAVTSTGYNASHEFIACGVPTVVMPADNATDDQYARADAMVDAGCSVRVDSATELATNLEKLLSDSSRRESMKMAANKVRLAWTDGALEAAQLIRAVRAGKHSAPARLHLRNLAEKLLTVVDRAPDRPTPVVTESLTSAMLNAPVEHLLSGSSAGYRARREAIMREWLER